MDKSKFNLHAFEYKEISRLVKFFSLKYKITPCKAENTTNFLYMIYTIVNYYVIHYDVLFKQWYINIQKK